MARMPPYAVWQCRQERRDASHGSSRHSVGTAVDLARLGSAADGFSSKFGPALNVDNESSRAREWTLCHLCSDASTPRCTGRAMYESLSACSGSRSRDDVDIAGVFGGGGESRYHYPQCARLGPVCVQSFYRSQPRSLEHELSFWQEWG